MTDDDAPEENAAASGTPATAQPGLPRTMRVLLDALAEGPIGEMGIADRLATHPGTVREEIDRLREHGIEVTHGNDGYEVTEVTGYDGPSIAFGLDAPFAVEYHDSLGSSNDRARQLAEASAPETVVIADEQTAPRGRDGREWESPAGGVWFSVLVRPDEPPERTPAYTMAMAVAVTAACREAGVQARIKWPNDVLAGEGGERGGRKLCGILTESGGEGDDRWLVIGVGLNANVDPRALPADADATSLSAELGADVDRRVLLQRTLERFDDLRGDLEGALADWRTYADTLGRRVRVETPGGTVEGEAVDVLFPGALIVETDDGEQEVITAGDCEHLRPVE
jgi:BirA family biotin operon repressor/biotin-[acetyl-CoA-carboxylase] ligase